MYDRKGVYFFLRQWDTESLNHFHEKKCKQDVWKGLESIRSTRVPKCATSRLLHPNGNKENG